mmetsp:Transcript_26721/g.48585  ORF Transcript_26721/g.48585 Transcript_26721/m.48585 type:complete len:88 (+) Transcript_26721:488-751(+)
MSAAFYNDSHRKFHNTVTLKKGIGIYKLLGAGDGLFALYSLLWPSLDKGVWSPYTIFGFPQAPLACTGTQHEQHFVNNPTSKISLHL